MVKEELAKDILTVWYQKHKKGISFEKYFEYYKNILNTLKGMPNTRKEMLDYIKGKKKT